jgi:hypothetical protein
MAEHGRNEGADADEEERIPAMQHLLDNPFLLLLSDPGLSSEWKIVNTSYYMFFAEHTFGVACSGA